MSLCFIQRDPGGPDRLFAGLLDVPFVKTGQSHGNTLPAEAHGAFKLCFAAGMESPGAGIGLTEMADYTGPFLYEGGFSPSLRAPEVPFGTWEEARERHLRIKELTGKNYLGK